MRAVSATPAVHIAGTIARAHRDEPVSRGGTADAHAAAMLALARFAARVAVVTSLLAYAGAAYAAPRPPLLPPLPPPGLSAGSARLYEQKAVAFESTGGKASQYVLWQDRKPISDRDFERLYRDTTHATDLTTGMRARAKKENAKTIAMAAGLTVVGIGGIAALAALPSSASGCRKEAAGCGRDVVYLGLMSVAGISTLVCEAKKGSACVFDEHALVTGVLLPQREVPPFVARYNEALAASLRELPVASVPAS